MNARNKNGQLTFESTFGPTEKAESEVPSSNDDISGLRAVRVLTDVPAIDKAVSKTHLTLPTKLLV